MSTSYIVTGTLQGQMVALDEPVPLRDQRIRLTVESLPQETMGGRRLLETLHTIRDKLAASGYRPRTKEEIDIQIQAECESWEN